MPTIPQIFLSYRRSDSPDVIGRIYDRLGQRFMKRTIFKDIDSIPLGVDFRTYLEQTIENCIVFLVVIGPHWLTVTTSTGQRRLKQPNDFVRIEVEAALARDIPVIPVLVKGATLPTAKQLPKGLQPLAYRKGLAVRPDPDFHNDMDRLIAGIEQLNPRRRAIAARLSQLNPPGLGETLAHAKLKVFER